MTGYLYEQHNHPSAKRHSCFVWHIKKQNQNQTATLANRANMQRRMVHVNCKTREQIQLSQNNAKATITREIRQVNKRP